MFTRKSKPEAKPQPHVQTRWQVDLYTGEIGDPDALNGLVFYGSLYRSAFTTRNIVLAKAVSDDIRQEKIRSLQAQQLRTARELERLSKT